MNEGKSKIIMIIDDDPDDKDLFIEIINQVDPQYDCLWGKDGVEGLKILSQLSKLPDYIFLDLNMPRMNGIQCLSEIKQNKKFSNIPVVIYSTSGQEADIEETKKLGAFHYITKPTRFADLHQALTELLSNKKDTASFFRNL